MKMIGPVRNRDSFSLLLGFVDNITQKSGDLGWLRLVSSAPCLGDADKTFTSEIVLYRPAGTPAGQGDRKHECRALAVWNRGVSRASLIRHDFWAARLAGRSPNPPNFSQHTKIPFLFCLLSLLSFQSARCEIAEQAFSFLPFFFTHSLPLYI